MQVNRCSIAAHSSGIQASLLATEKFIAKLHREGLLMGYAGKAGLCGKYPMPIIKKSQYKTQMTYPVPTFVVLENPFVQGLVVKHNKLSGNVSLDFPLEKISKESPKEQELLLKLRSRKR